jgi:hypothetical protein
VSCLDEQQGVFLALLAAGADAFHRLAGEQRGLSRGAGRGSHASWDGCRQGAVQGCAHATSAHLIPPNVAAQRAPLEEALQQAGVLRKLAEARGSRSFGRLPLEVVPPAAGGGAVGTAPLWHFAAAFPGRRQGVQAAHAGHVFPDRRAVKELSRAYVRAYCTMHAQQLQGGAGSSGTGGGGAGGGGTGSGAAAAAAYVLQGGGPRPARMLWVASPRWVLLATADRELELFCCFDPLVAQESAARCGEALRRWLLERPRLEALLLPGAA